MPFNEHRRRVLVLIGATALACGPGAARSAPQCGQWDPWEAFKRVYVGNEGRVRDRRRTDPATTSQAQTQAMFLALLANDSGVFERLLDWTIEHMAGGDLARRLPAWRWGRREDRRWGVLDPMPAADADIWLAYTLLEAGRLWEQPNFTALAERLMANIVSHEMAQVTGLGIVLLPAPYGFVESDAVRLNPSYLPLQVLRRLAGHRADPNWRAVLASANRVLLESSPRGIAADWVVWRRGQGFQADSVSAARGSDDAIRVYLWLGMLSEGDPMRARLLRHYAPVTRLLSEEGWPPQSIDTRTGEARGTGPSGFSAALLPFFAAGGPALDGATRKLRMATHSGVESARCEDEILLLLGTGWDEGRFRFAADGMVQPLWAASCGRP